MQIGRSNTTMTTSAELAGASLPSDELMNALLRIGVIRHWKINQVLHWSGECPSSVLCVRAGRARMRRFDSAGNEQILSWFSPGPLLAVAGVIANKPFHFDIVADGPCEMLHIGRDRFMELLRGNAAMAAEISITLSERLLFVSESHVRHANEALVERIWLRLTRIAQQSNGGALASGFGVPLTQQELADAVGASRYRVGLELKRLAERGLIAMTRGSIHVFPHKTIDSDKPNVPSRG